jgi:hypothetical protein
LNAVFTAHRGTDIGTLMDLFIATGVSRDKVEKFLGADGTAGGSVRDQIAADMANQLLQALGQRARQTAGSVRRIRERGNWVGLDQRPRE